MESRSPGPRGGLFRVRGWIFHFYRVRMKKCPTGLVGQGTPACRRGVPSVRSSKLKESRAVALLVFKPEVKRVFQCRERCSFSLLRSYGCGRERQAVGKCQACVYIVQQCTPLHVHRVRSMPLEELDVTCHGSCWQERSSGAHELPAATVQRVRERPCA